MNLTNQGFTLVELLVVIAVLSIISAIALVSFSGVIETFQAKTCAYSAGVLEKNYEFYLELSDQVHSDDLFKEYLIKEGNFCPTNGNIKYVDGTVYCSEHNALIAEDEPDILFL